MASEAFVDTSGFYALLVQRDDMHGRAADAMKQAAATRMRLVTTDYVLDETSTLLKARSLDHLVAQFFDTVFASEACRVEWMDPSRFAATRARFLKHLDQRWSFTDCFSFEVMREHRLNAAWTKDEHFRQAGFEPLFV